MSKKALIAHYFPIGLSNRSLLAEVRKANIQLLGNSEAVLTAVANESFAQQPVYCFQPSNIGFSYRVSAAGILNVLPQGKYKPLVGCTVFHAALDGNLHRLFFHAEGDRFIWLTRPIEAAGGKWVFCFMAPNKRYVGKQLLIDTIDIAQEVLGPEDFVMVGR